MSYRNLATKVTDFHNRYGGAVVGVDKEQDLLGEVGAMELRIPEEAMVCLVGDSHLTRKIVRKAFWELRHRREWGLDRGVVWTSEEGGTSHVGMGVLVKPDTPMPALTKVVTLGGPNG